MNLLSQAIAAELLAEATAAQTLRAERDELLAALQAIMGNASPEYAAFGVYTIGVNGSDLDKARAAIAKATNAT